MGGENMVKEQASRTSRSSRTAIADGHEAKTRPEEQYTGTHLSSTEASSCSIGRRLRRRTRSSRIRNKVRCGGRFFLEVEVGNKQARRRKEKNRGRRGSGGLVRRSEGGNKGTTVGPPKNLPADNVPRRSGDAVRWDARRFDAMLAEERLPSFANPMQSQSKPEALQARLSVVAQVRGGFEQNEGKGPEAEMEGSWDRGL
ncbi:hypothetical protein J3F83DRAFT_312559 [Trichoderma novae-zelandiae]